MIIKPLISIIVPIYKVDKYLNRCIQSIVNQTYTNLEIILVDDGSPDQCPHICDEWAKKDSRIMVIHKDNAGLSDARNVGLKAASGKYIGFVDSDDFISEHMYEYLIDAIVSTDSNLAICNVEYIDDKNNKPIYKKSPIQNEVLSQRQALEKLVKNGWWYYITAWNKLYSRRSLQGISFPEGKIHEDQFIVHNVFLNCNKIACIDAKLYNYVQRVTGIMNSSASVRHLDDVEALCKRYDYFREHKYEDLCEGTYAIMKEKYDSSRKKVAGHLLSKEERKRVKQIDLLFRERCFETELRSNLKNRIKYGIPDICFPVLYVCDRFRIKQRLQTVRQLMEYNKAMKLNNGILIDTPTHENLGDHAIVLAEQQLLSTITPPIKYIELTASQINGHENKFAKFTPKDKLILVHGGGFLGSLWPVEEYRFRRIVQAFKNNRIVVFPQTVTFDIETEEGKHFLEESQRIYSAHPDITIFVREKKSYAFMQEYFPSVQCRLVPDIVTLMNTSIIEPCNRNGVLFCIRRDPERSIEEAVLQDMLAAVYEIYPAVQVEFTDTVIDHNVMPENRELEVKRKLDQFSKARLVVTDRLHGMIFAVLTNTPCIAMSNSNGKVRAVYDWIKENEYILFANTENEFRCCLNKLDLNKKYRYDKALLQMEFESLYVAIKEKRKCEIEF